MAISHLHDLPSEALDRLEIVVRAFEDAWQQGRRPNIDSHLPKSADERRAVLIELIHVDLECRLRASQAVRVEHYLKKYPELRSDQALIVRLLASEMRHRRGKEPGLAIDEYLRRFPTLAEELKAGLGTDAETLAGGARPEPTVPALAPTRRCTREQFVGQLTDLPILSSEQRQELVALRGQFDSAAALADELKRRGWLTSFQASQLLDGKGAALRLGAYIVLDRLGEGGMGQVVKARHQVMKRLVAVKMIRKGILSYGEQVQRFYQEIEAVARLSHPNIVLAHDAGVVNDIHFFAMEYVEGMDLARVLRETGPLPVDKACDYVRQAALGLQHAHERGLVHRDIKPSNLLLVSGGVVSGESPDHHAPRITHHSQLPTDQIKILDLGLARIHAARNKSRLTQVGEVMGTVDYIAPEQATDASQVDIRADIYSLGCTLYHLIAGQPVFVGGSMAQKLLRHRTEEPRPLGAIRTLPDGLDAVLTRMLAKKPEDRYATPREVAEALMPHCPQAAAPAVMPAASHPATTRKPLITRRRLTVGTAAVIVLATSLIFLLRRPAIPTPPVQPTGEPFSPHALVSRPAMLPGVKSWTVETTGHRGVINDIAVSPDGKWLASAGSDATIRLWNIQEDFALARVLVGAQPCQRLAWSPDGKRLACFAGAQFSTDNVTIWDLENGARVSGSFKIMPTAIAWSPDSLILAVSGYHGDTMLLSRAGKLIDEGAKCGTPGVYLPSGDLAAFDKNKVRIYKPEALNKPVREIELPDAAIALDGSGKADPLKVAWSPTGDRLAAVNKEHFRVFDVASRKRLCENEKPKTEKSSRRLVAWSNNGRRCAIAVAADVANRMYLEILNAATGEVEYFSEELVYQSVTALTFTQDDRRVIVATQHPGNFGASFLQVLDVAQGAAKTRPSEPFGSSAPQEWDSWLAVDKDYESYPVSKLGQRIRDAGVRTAHRSPDGAMSIILAAGAGGAVVMRYDLVANKQLPPLALVPPPEGNSALAWSHDSQQILLGDYSGGLRIIAARTGIEVVTLAEWRGKTMNFGIALSPDGKKLAAAQHHRLIWCDVESQKTQRTLDYHIGAGSPRVAYSPAGGLFAATTQEKVTIWDAAALHADEKSAPLASWTTPGSAIEMAFSHDGKVLATAGNFGGLALLPAVVRFWNPRTGQPLGCVHALAGEKGLAVSADGHVCVTGNKAERELTYVAETERGQETFTPGEFMKRFGWTNDEEKATLPKVAASP